MASGRKRPCFIMIAIVVYSKETMRIWKRYNGRHAVIVNPCGSLTSTYSFLSPHFSFFLFCFSPISYHLSHVTLHLRQCPFTTASFQFPPVLSLSSTSRKQTSPCSLPRKPFPFHSTPSSPLTTLIPSTLSPTHIPRPDKALVPGEAEQTYKK